MLYLMVILQVLAANNVVVPDWLLCIGWWLVAVRLVLRILIAFLTLGRRASRDGRGAQRFARSRAANAHKGDVPRGA